ncbi:conserved hypothetical protein [Culex quinquefasciatus]|uniref:Uncharacterized protein n=1 Tax=Culex quinquefasciatus TaxID=7176 RepID=B0XHM3_CULQU|nr:conserved hypothetical protein [Culex quinquefasciatus]|eukprot:XP_001869145.1 conserved hypothetical protein [Culex quinquefasciatus]
MARDHDESFARFNFPDQIVNFLLDAQVDPDNPDKIVEIETQQPLQSTSGTNADHSLRRPGGAHQRLQSTSGKNADHSPHAPGGAHQQPQSTSGWEKIPKEEGGTEQVLLGYFVRSPPCPRGAQIPAANEIQQPLQSTSNIQLNSSAAGFARGIRPPVDGLPANVGEKVPSTGGRITEQGLARGIRPSVDGLPANVDEKFRPPVDGLLDKVLHEESVRRWTDYLPMLTRSSVHRWTDYWTRGIRPPVDGLPANVDEKFRPPVDGLLDKVLDSTEPAPFMYDQKGPKYEEFAELYPGRWRGGLVRGVSDEARYDPADLLRNYCDVDHTMTRERIGRSGRDHFNFERDGHGPPFDADVAALSPFVLPVVQHANIFCRRNLAKVENNTDLAALNSAIHDLTALTRYARRNPGLIEFMIDKNMETQRAAREASRVDIPVSDMHDLRSADAARHLNLNHFEQRADSERHGAVESPEAPGLRDRLLAVQLSLVVDPEALRTLSHAVSPQIAQKLNNLDEKAPHHFHWKALAAALDPLDLNDADTGEVPSINTGNAPSYPKTPIEILLCCMLIAISFFMITYHNEWRTSWTTNNLKSCWQLTEVRLFQGIYETEHTRNKEVPNIKLTGDKVVAARLSGRIDFLQLETYTQGRQIDWGFTSAYRRTHIRTGSAGSLSMFQQPNGPANVHHGSEEELRCILEFHQQGHQMPVTCLEVAGGTLGILTQPGGSASFQRKEQEKLQLKTRTPTVDSASVEFLNPFNAGKKALKTVEIPMEDRLERGKSSGMSQKNMAHLLLQGLRSKDAEIRRSVFSMNEQELIQQTAFRPHPQSQLMALGSENLLANFSTCLAIIEYRVQHANSLSKFTEYQIGHARSNYKKMEQNIYKINKVKSLMEQTLHQRYPPGNSVLISLDANASGPLNVARLFYGKSVFS